MQTQEEMAWRLLIARTVTTRFVPVRGTKTFVVEAGDGETPVVFIGGLGESSLTWAPVLPALAAVTSVLAYDRPGLGASDPTKQARTVDDMVFELNELLTTISTRPAVFVGHSLGGLVAAQMARRFPERVAGLVLVDPADESMLRSPGMVALQRLALALPRVLSVMRIWPHLVTSAAKREAAAVQEPVLRDALANALVESRLRSVALRASSAEFSGLMAGAGDLSRASHELAISQPLLVLSATSGAVGKSSRSKWTANQAALAAASPAGRHLVVAGTGHYIHRERPAVVIDEVGGLLSRL